LTFLSAPTLPPFGAKNISLVADFRALICRLSAALAAYCCGAILALQLGTSRREPCALDGHLSLIGAVGGL
jgi:hypothetical protein